MLAISIIALVISGFALVFTGWAAGATAKQARAAHEQTEIQRSQVAAAREQTELQRELARQASQPYAWADIWPDMQQGNVLHVVVGNSGPTVARNVRVTFDPPLPSSEQKSDLVQSVQQVLANGLRSLAPNRVIRWSLGAASDMLASEEPQVRLVRVEGEGPNGPLPILEMQIDISEWRQARDAPDGSLHHVRGEIKGLTNAVNGVNKTMRRAVNRFESAATAVFEAAERSAVSERQISPPALGIDARLGNSAASSPPESTAERDGW